jgi:signal transduction histidine kinase
MTARVFEPFVQAGVTTDKSPGVGFGLSIARGLLRGAAGDLVLVASESGAVFEIRMKAGNTQTCT